MSIRKTPVFMGLMLLLAPPLAMAAAAPAPAALPDGLAATLLKLAGNAPIAGTLVVDQTSVDGEGAKAKHGQASITLDVSAARGIDLHVPGSVLEEADQQIAAHQLDPERSMPTAELLGSVGIVQTQRMLDPAAALRVVLIGARLLQQAPTTLDGAPATLLRFDLPLHASKSERDKIKSYHDELSLWLDAQGVPIAFTRTTKTDLGWFVLNVDTDRSEQGRFQVVDGRLITPRIDTQQHTSALGHHGSTTTRYTLQVTAPAPRRVANPVAAAGA